MFITLCTIINLKLIFKKIKCLNAKFGRGIGYCTMDYMFRCYYRVRWYKPWQCNCIVTQALGIGASGWQGRYVPSAVYVTLSICCLSNAIRTGVIWTVFVLDGWCCIPTCVLIGRFFCGESSIFEIVPPHYE